MRPPKWIERPVRYALVKSAAFLPPGPRDEAADTAWQVCADAGARGGPSAFALAAAGEVADLLTNRLAAPRRSWSSRDGVT